MSTAGEWRELESQWRLRCRDASRLGEAGGEMYARIAALCAEQARAEEQAESVVMPDNRPHPIETKLPDGKTIVLCGACLKPL